MEGNKKGSIIFDGDDTLWQTQVLYDEAKEKYYVLMENQGFDREAVNAKLAEMDMANVGKLGFSKHRFPQSMREVYEYFCKQRAQPIDPVVLEEVGRIGYSVFRREPRLMTGAREVLDRLKQAYRLYLYTGGEPDLQRKKAEALGLAKYFEALYVREHKSENELREIIDEQELNAEKTWVVGNSLRSDINPALRVGLRCIWIRGGSWEYDEEVLLNGKVWQVSELTEILPILSKVDGLK